MGNVRRPLVESPADPTQNFEFLWSNELPSNALKPQAYNGSTSDLSSILPDFADATSMTVVQLGFGLTPGNLQAVDGGSFPVKKRDLDVGGYAVVLLKPLGIQLGDPVVNATTNITTTKVAGAAAFSFKAGSSGVWYEFLMAKNRTHLLVGIYSASHFLGFLDYPIPVASSSMSLMFMEGLAKLKNPL
ncbi:UNVERIFIED_CONTAM: hypothetical protein HDU68_006555, partial [Siphonaria sp. JEL0065]